VFIIEGMQTLRVAANPWLSADEALGEASDSLHRAILRPDTEGYAHDRATGLVLQGNALRALRAGDDAGVAKLLAQLETLGLSELLAEVSLHEPVRQADWATVAQVSDFPTCRLVVAKGQALLRHDRPEALPLFRRLVDRQCECLTPYRPMFTALGQAGLVALDLDPDGSHALALQKWHATADKDLPLWEFLSEARSK
jgi:hypothetical protein